MNISSLPVSRERCAEINSVMAAARAKRERIISREGDCFGLRRTDDYLDMLVEEEIAQRQLIAIAKAKKEDRPETPKYERGNRRTGNRATNQPRQYYHRYSILSIECDEYYWEV